MANINPFFLTLSGIVSICYVSNWYKEKKHEALLYKTHKGIKFDNDEVIKLYNRAKEIRNGIDTGPNRQGHIYLVFKQEYGKEFIVEKDDTDYLQFVKKSSEDKVKRRKDPTAKEFMTPYLNLHCDNYDYIATLVHGYFYNNYESNVYNPYSTENHTTQYTQTDIKDGPHKCILKNEAIRSAYKDFTYLKYYDNVTETSKENIYLAIKFDLQKVLKWSISAEPYSYNYESSHAINE